MHIYRPQQPLVCMLPIAPSRNPSPTAIPTAAASALRSTAAIAPSTADDTLSRQAAEAVTRQRYPQALHLLSELIDRHPNCAIHYSNRGLVHLRLGQTWAALADCDQAVDLDPNLDQAYNNRALCHSALGDLTAALEDYERAVDLNPFNSRARINLGATLRQMDALDRALDCFDEALMFHQLSEFIYAERGRTYHLRGDWNCALADYQRALDAAKSLQSSVQLQTLVKRVQGWINELVPQQRWN